MSKKTVSFKKSNKLILKWGVLGILTAVTFLLFIYILFLVLFKDRFYPGVRVGLYPVGGKTLEEAETLLESDFALKTQQSLGINYQEKTYTLNLKNASPSLQASDALTEAMSWGKTGSPLVDLKEQFQALFWSVNFKPTVSYQRQTILSSQISQINQKIQINPQNAKLIVEDAVTIIPSQEGSQIDEASLLSQINNYLISNTAPPQTFSIITAYPKFTTSVAEVSKKALENVKRTPIQLRFEDNVWTIDQPTLLTLLDQTGTQPLLTPVISDNQVPSVKKILLSASSEKEIVVPLDKNKLAAYLAGIAATIDQQVQEARFVFNPTSKRVTAFQPARDGQSLNQEKLAILIAQAAITNTPSEITLPVNIEHSKIATGDINTFGIKELIGQGISHFEGSISNRIYNFSLAAQRINGVLIAPGKIFSFNSALGEVSADTGFKQAYVIKSGRTVLDDGGGVCQLSTTVFRAALNAGLPIVERTAHAYRVGYYEQGFPPGLDATVWPPSVDLKFKNNTPSYLLLQARIEGLTMYIDLYGTSDNRKAVLTTPKVTNIVPPPPEIRQDDPTLPKGTIKQVDWPVSGANVSFNRTVTRGGQVIIQETWRSNFRPWPAVYLVGTKEG